MNTLSVEREQFELFKEGNKEAYAYFFARHHEGVYNYIRNMAADAVIANDLSQDSFKRLWDLRVNIHSSQQLGAYIYVIARHLFVGQLRSLNVVSDVGGEPAYGGRDEIVNSELEAVCHRELAEMKTAMESLSAKRRLVLHLLFIRNLDVSTVAVMLELSPQTVRNHKAQAIAFLREKIFDRDLVMPLSLSILLRYAEEQ
jgi:RNA polymerase sigma-70 factor (ECF subfamily)